MEEWKQITSRHVINKKGQIRNIKTGKLLKTYKNRYEYIDLWYDGKHHTFLIHRLVAEAFIPNPNKLLEVNHKDENKLNNDVNNLEWCDRKYNHNYGTILNRMHINMINRKDQSKPVNMFTLNNEFVKNFPSIMEAYRQTNINFRGISHCCKGERKTAGGYKWRYEN